MIKIYSALVAKAIAWIFLASYFNVVHANKSFSGEWRYVQYIDTSKKPYSTFDIRLVEGNDGKIQGSYCFITQGGNRIDCDPDGEEINITGRAAPDDSSTEVHFYSFFGAKDGVARLSRVGNDLIWQVIKNPSGDFFYGPYKA
ncbi:hypothetical protein EO087_12010 [Dyella sp. M7H15-1]|uniref:hypothetical protein n=1 Tax=Dyella sp. M7H15-1 TaxID=2501295 RepID=UPI001004F146|nr:hypothetical protein [Dyella sp. M7H15-1]QAU24627.1 hypothetical protein EO087_12010 [Dyella sp. M7H15-1]